MTEISDRYRRVTDHFAVTIAAVPEGRWGDPAPCEGWDAREVVRHVIDAHGIFEGLVDRSIAPGPSVDDDPAAAFAHTTAQVQAELDDPATADIEFDGFFGRTTFAEAINRFLTGDMVVHRWDLARATGGDETIPEVDLEGAMAELEQMGEAVRGEGVFGPALTPPEGADAQTRFLCFTGRQP